MKSRAGVRPDNGQTARERFRSYRPWDSGAIGGERGVRFADDFFRDMPPEGAGGGEGWTL
jgi:hypothetical protein